MATTTQFTDTQARGDQLKGSQYKDDPYKSDSQHVASDQVDRLARSAHDAVDRAASAANSAADSVAAQTEKLNRARAQALTSATTYLQEKPLQALGLAVIAGYFLARLTRH
jgi:ElaB/YqjD/DUF883 family membrane-anchored ribosome-binding protein